MPTETIVVINLYPLGSELLGASSEKLNSFAESTCIEFLLIGVRGGGVIQMWKKNARKWSESCIAWIALTVSVARTVALSLKSSQMSRVNDVIYFHSLVWMWFVMWTVSKQIPVTSASYSMCWEANPASRAQRGVLDSSTDPGEDWTGTPLL